MSVISIGGGPRPQARVVAVYENPVPGGIMGDPSYEIREGNDILVSGLKNLNHAIAIRNILQEGE